MTRAWPEHCAREQAQENQAAASVADEVKASQDVAENRPGEKPPIRSEASCDDVENRRLRNRAEREQSANPDGNRQDCGEPEH